MNVSGNLKMPEQLGRLRDFVTPLHLRTARDYQGRMMDDKVHCMEVARQYEKEYWDGDRRYGYGGYQYIPDRWKPVAEALIATYSLDNSSSVLDVGCGKGFLLYEIQKLIPGSTLMGLDVSNHGINEARERFGRQILLHRAEEAYSFPDQHFDLVISLGCLHNLKLPQLEVALSEVQRVGRAAYVMVESYRNEQELFNLQCWALTAESFLDPVEWAWMYKKCRYHGDYEFIYFS